MFCFSTLAIKLTRHLFQLFENTSAKKLNDEQQIYLLNSSSRARSRCTFNQRVCLTSIAI